jgi:hypothetical protein
MSNLTSKVKNTVGRKYTQSAVYALKTGEKYQYPWDGDHGSRQTSRWKGAGLARANGDRVATLDGKIPGGFLIPQSR